ncbi:MAG: FAD-dependent oxidoreductase [bacterium]|nr:FAD-dependent oxidoreductase [bacterium]
MSTQNYQYIIIGGGLAGVSAIDGIRERDTTGSILLLSDEHQLPYDRPPLSKKLWFEKKQVADIFLHDPKFYADTGVHLALGTKIISLDTQQKRVSDRQGNSFSFAKLLLATGGSPRKLSIPGSDLAGIFYYRELDDYLALRKKAFAGKSVVIIGGGFIGSELAAALNINQLEVTMIFPEAYLVSRVFPDYLGKAIQQHYLERGVKILNNDNPTSISQLGDKLLIKTEAGKQLVSDLVIVGIGIAPKTKLAANAGLQTGNGIIVNEFLQTSHPDIYAAGDNALFPYQALGQQMRIEHWDNALNQGKYAGRNMAGANEPFTYMPYFFSDLFEFGYEAVGEVNSALETFADWQEPNTTGVIYYLKDSKIRGVMLCNVWEKVESARELIRKGEPITPDKLHNLIK